jgi:hypothetical protein
MSPRDHNRRGNREHKDSRTTDVREGLSFAGEFSFCAAGVGASTTTRLVVARATHQPIVCAAA